MTKANPNPWLCLLVLCLVCPAGCQPLRQMRNSATSPLEQPAEPTHSFRVNQLLFHSDLELKKEQELLDELGQLSEQVYKDLHLPPSTALIHVYVFKDVDRYHEFMNYRYQNQNLPDRRAFFIVQPRGTEDDLIVYTYWSDRVRQDLRHELTHAVLHSVLKDVPLWLDEGLAEYFELPPARKGVNFQHVSRLCSKTEKTTLNLARLEQLTRIEDMTPAEYREAWAWVHLMLDSTPETRQVLLDYLRSLRTSNKPGPLHTKLSTIFPSPEDALVKHIERLDAGH